jgi:hypothetical protein
MVISRRSLLKAGLTAAGGIALARPLGVLAGPLRPTSLFTTARQSKLFPGTFLAHADLHNHSLQSDGEGDPALAFQSMRGAGLDVAALTDHSTLSWGVPANVCPNSDCQSLAGINEQTWAAAASLADLANASGSFVAIRGFEWSSPTIGHMNVWFSTRWMDPLHTGGAGTGEGAAQFAHDEASVPAGPMTTLDAIVKQAPTTAAGMALFYEWLRSNADTPVVGGGSDGLAQFNHPGREPGRFSNFRRLAAAPPNIVGMEIFNRREEYLYEGTDSIAESPLNECLNAGWRVGLAGSTDEHGTDWGVPIGKGRTGLFVTELTRVGVADALRNRRFFATREAGLRVDASANGVRMGQSLSHTSGPVTFMLDVDRSDWVGKPLAVQVLRRGTLMPAVQASFPISVPAAGDPPLSFTLPIDVADGDWVVLRISDPSEPADARATGDWAGYGRGIAYCSPFFFAV